MSAPAAAQNSSKPGYGTIHLALLPPNTPRLKTVKYSYPLKLVSPAPLRTDEGSRCLVHTVYLLTYGGGLVAGDSVDLRVILEPDTRLILLTQGSTKLFKSPSRNLVSRQCMTVDVSPGSALCYLPDPVQPFEKACFEQRQTYNLAIDAKEPSTAGNICVLDWVSNGRSANGENWSFFHYGSKNEVSLYSSKQEHRLLLRDNMLLDDGGQSGGLVHRMDGLGVYGTVILYGSLFLSLGRFFMEEFNAIPRLGGRKWDGGSDSDDEEMSLRAIWRSQRQREESVDGLLWSAASVRGCVVVKFGAKDVEGGRKWLRKMLLEEGTVVREFGERVLLCLR